MRGTLDAGTTRRLVVVADGVEEEAELGLLEDVAAETEQNGEDQHGERNALVGGQDGHDHDAEGGGDRQHHGLEERRFQAGLVASGDVRQHQRREHR